MLTCAHCGEAVERADGVWYHPHRRFQGHNGGLPTLCDFGGRLGPTHATPVAVTPADKDFLSSIHVAVDDENFLLQALWLDWENANIHHGDWPCFECGAAPGEQHALECTHHAAMMFDGAAVRHNHHLRR
jgi:hypothetical protein